MSGSVHGITAENIVVFKCFLQEVPISLFFKLIITISFLFSPQKIDWKKTQNKMWVVEIRSSWRNKFNGFSILRYTMRKRKCQKVPESFHGMVQFVGGDDIAKFEKH